MDPRVRQAAEDMAQHHSMTLPEAAEVLRRMMVSETQPLRTTSVPLSRWSAWRVRWWMRLGRQRRAQAIILRHCDRG